MWVCAAFGCVLRRSVTRDNEFDSRWRYHETPYFIGISSNLPADLGPLWARACGERFGNGCPKH